MRHNWKTPFMYIYMHPDAAFSSVLLLFCLLAKALVRA